MIRRLLASARRLAAYSAIDLIARRAEVLRLGHRLNDLERRLAELDAWVDVDAEPLTELERLALRLLVRRLEQNLDGAGHHLLTAARKALGLPAVS